MIVTKKALRVGLVPQGLGLTRVPAVTSNEEIFPSVTDPGGRDTGARRSARNPSPVLRLQCSMSSATIHVYSPRARSRRTFSLADTSSRLCPGQSKPYRRRIRTVELRNAYPRPRTPPPTAPF